MWKKLKRFLANDVFEANDFFKTFVVLLLVSTCNIEKKGQREYFSLQKQKLKNITFSPKNLFKSCQKQEWLFIPGSGNIPNRPHSWLTINVGKPEQC